MKITEISSLLAIITVILIGFFVLLQNRHKRQNQLFALLTLAISTWNLGIHGTLVVNTEYEALLSTKIIFIGAVFMPILLLQFAFTILNVQLQRKWLFSLWALTIFFFVISPTNFFSKGVIKFGGRYFADANIGLASFIFMAVTLTTYAIYKLYKGYRSSQGMKRSQLFYIFLATLIYILGIELVIPTLFRFPFLGAYPWWNYTSVLFAVMIAYAITKTGLMDISVIISRTTAWIMTVVFFGAIYLGLVGLYQANVGPQIGLFFLAWTIIFGIIVGETFQRVRLFLQTTSDKLFLHGKYDYYQSLSDASSRVGQKLSLPDILKVLYDTFYEVVEVADPRVFLPENFTEVGNQPSVRYVVYNKENYLPVPDGQEIKFDDPLVKELITKREPIFEGKRFNASLIVPCMVEDRLIGVLVLGHKLSEDPYTDEDLRLLKILSNQVAITLDHTRSYEKIKTDLEVAERQMERSQRLASLGTLTAGVTHEIRNPLTVIRAETERLANQPRDLAFLKEHRDLLLKHIDRISGIVQRMLGLAKEKEKHMIEVDVSELVRTTIKFFTISNVTVKEDYQPVPAIKGNPEELQEVVVNLIQNAIEAMSGGGTLTLKTYAEDNRVVAEITDTGKGIPEEIREKIFDPFYSTRHEGTGLGLSIVYRIIREHGGDIKLSSEVGKGTTFKLIF